MSGRGLQVWSKTAASNNTIDSGVNWAEGMAPSAVNDSARAEMASAAMYRDDNNGTLVTTGTTAAFTVTTNQVAAALTDGYTVTVKFHATTDTAATLAQDGLAAKQLQVVAGTNLVGGEYIAGQVQRFTYIAASTAWVANNSPPKVTSGGQTFYDGITLATGGVTLSTGAILNATGATTAPTYSFSGDDNSGWYRKGADNLAVTIAGVDEVTHSSTGTAFTHSVVCSSGFVSVGTATFAAGAIANAALASPGGLVLIQTQAASNSATIDFITGLDDTLYDAFVIVISSAKPASDDVQMQILIGTGVGPTYQSSGYAWSVFQMSLASSAADGSASDTKIGISLAGGSTAAVGNATGENYGATINFNNPEASDFMEIYGSCGWSRSDGVRANAIIGGRLNTAGAVTGIRFKFSSGNIASGRFTLYGRTKA